MTESTFWQHIRPKLAPYGLLERIENATGTRGTADVNYCLLGVEGWFETKYLPRWPARASSLVRLPHFHPSAEGGIDQVRWHERRAAAKSRTCLLVQIEREYMIFPVPTLQRIHDGVPRATMYTLAGLRGGPAFPTTAVVRYLTGR